MPPDPQPLTFRPQHRLTHNREYQAVYDARMRKSRAGLMVSTCPNSLPHHRLGLAVSAKTMPRAVDRNRAKRLVRESFRLTRHDLPLVPRAEGLSPVGLDIIVSVRTARRMTLEDCRALLSELIAESAAEWMRRNNRA